MLYLIYLVQKSVYFYVYIYRKVIKSLKRQMFLQNQNCQYKIPSLMNSQRDKETQQILKNIHEANKSLDQFSNLYGQKLYELMENQDQQGIEDFGKLMFEQQTNAQSPIEKTSFFSQIPSMPVDQQTQDKILNFKLNYVSARRKDELFKKHRKQQQDKFTSRKRQMEKYYGYKMDNFRSIKGQFTFKRGDQSHTCSITGDDLDKLRPQTDLNDTIIANYLKYLQYEYFSEEIEKGMFAHSSFFIQKLVGETLRQDFLLMQRDMRFINEKIKLKVAENYKNVKRWTRRVDIFEKQHIIIPINAFKHWYCIIVVNPGSILDPKSQKKSCIVNCDSMFEKKFFIIDAIRMYLQVQLEDKKKINIDINESNFPCYQLLLPRQTNTHDCGLYTLTYVEHLLANKNQLQNLDIIQNRQKLHLFPRNLVYSMRQRLKQLFINLIQNSDENVRKQILKKYKQETQKITRQAGEQDYDKINMRQFKKYESMNSYLLQASGFNVNELSDDEVEYAMKIRFYLDPEVNFYERDKQYLM